VNSILFLESPRPYTVVTGIDDNDDGTNHDLPPGYTRNSERGAWTFQWDVRLRASLFRGGQGDTDLLVDIFNVTNRANFGNAYFNKQTSLNFGEPSKVVTTPRQVQIGLRHTF
jgi:hypothetical protein